MSHGSPGRHKPGILARVWTRHLVAERGVCARLINVDLLSAVSVDTQLSIVDVIGHDRDTNANARRHAGFSRETGVLRTRFQGACLIRFIN